MARIGILNCSNCTQDLACSSAGCLGDLRKRRGWFEGYGKDDPLDLVGIINCPGCPTLAGSDKLLNRVRSLTEFKIDTLHLSYCLKALCPFTERYVKDIERNFPHLTIVRGTHQEHLTADEFRDRVGCLFNQPRKNMVDMILGRDR
ncbi:MAG: CGGC domain-containing protein [Geobacteraceae bacterium]|nr:CGGC domain-containing protein [Geobacteraceae bacterium]